MTRKLTSFTCIGTTEGETIAYTYSEIGDDGTIVSRNNRETYVTMDAGTIKHIDAIRKAVSDRLAVK